MCIGTLPPREIFFRVRPRHGDVPLERSHTSYLLSMKAYLYINIGVRACVTSPGLDCGIVD